MTDGGKEVSRRTNEGTDTTYTLEPLKDASAQDWLGSNQDPDVLLAVPNLGVDRIKITVDDIQAHLRLHAKVLDLLELHVGVDASIKKVDIEIDNVRVQAMLKVKLDKVAEIVSRVMDTIDANPEILTNLTKGIGKGVEGALTQGGTSDDDDGKEMDDSLETHKNVKYDQHQDDNDEAKEQDERDGSRAGSGSNSGRSGPRRRRRHQG